MYLSVLIHTAPLLQPLSNHSSHTPVFFIPSPRVLSFCCIFPMQVSVEEFHFSPLLQFLLTGSCFLLNVFLPCIFPLSVFFQPPSLPSVLFLFSSSTCVASRSQTAQLLSYIPHRSSSPTLFLFLPLLPMTINLISETSLHSSPGSADAGFNIRLLFRSSLTSSTLSSWRPKRTKFWSVLCETDFVGSPESWENM